MGTVSRQGLLANLFLVAIARLLLSLLACYYCQLYFVYIVRMLGRGRIDLSPSCEGVYALLALA